MSLPLGRGDCHCRVPLADDLSPNRFYSRMKNCFECVVEWDGLLQLGDDIELLGESARDLGDRCADSKTSPEGTKQLFFTPFQGKSTLIMMENAYKAHVYSPSGTGGLDGNGQLWFVAELSQWLLLWLTSLCKLYGDRWEANKNAASHAFRQYRESLADPPSLTERSRPWDSEKTSSIRARQLSSRLPRRTYSQRLA